MKALQQKFVVSDSQGHDYIEYMYMCMYVYMHMCVFMRVCLYICMSCTHAYMLACMYTCLHVCIHICIAGRNQCTAGKGWRFRRRGE